MLKLRQQQHQRSAIARKRRTPTVAQSARQYQDKLEGLLRSTLADEMESVSNAISGAALFVLGTHPGRFSSDDIVDIINQIQLGVREPAMLSDAARDLAREARA